MVWIYLFFIRFSPRIECKEEVRIVEKKEPISVRFMVGEEMILNTVRMPLDEINIIDSLGSVIIKNVKYDVINLEYTIDSELSRHIDIILEQ